MPGPPPLVGFGPPGAGIFHPSGTVAGEQFVSTLLPPYYNTVIADGATWYVRLGESSGTFLDEIGSNDSSAVLGSVTYGATSLLSGDANTAVTFGGTTSDAIQFPDGAYADLGDFPWTIELWIKRNAGGLGNNQTILNKGTNAYGIGFEVDNLLALNKVGVARLDHSSAAINDTNAHHIVVTRSAANTSVIYIDGAADTVHEVNAALADNATVLEIGREAGWAGFDGTIDEVAIYNYVLTPDQVRRHYAAATIFNPSAWGGVFQIDEPTDSIAEA